MNSLHAYILPLKGLGDGNHHFKFTVEDDFFQAFESSPIEKGTIELNVSLDKRPTLLVFDFSFAGWVATSCDRCLANIQLPIDGENRLLVKYGEGELEYNDEDVVFISQDTSSWSIAQFVYEYVLLALPLIKVYDCQAEAEPPCDKQMLAKLAIVEAPEISSKEENNPLWDALKGWNEKPE
jgi:uncharacterized metal-binding protein YceD (DUF177 family)